MGNAWSLDNMRIEFQIIEELKNSIHQLIPLKGLKFKFDLKGKTRNFDSSNTSTHRILEMDIVIFLTRLFLGWLTNYTYIRIGVYSANKFG